MHGVCHLLARHRDADNVLRRDEVVRVLRGVSNGELDALDSAVEHVATRAVIRGNSDDGESTNTTPGWSSPLVYYNYVLT
jgi:hypothetical protein